MSVKIKQWLQERWLLLDAALESLTVEQEDEVSRLCQAEMDYWKNERNIALGALGNHVSQTRTHLTAHFSVLNETNSWFNARKGVQEHISLKYMNLEKGVWAERLVPSQEKLEARLQDRQFIADPDAVVARATSLLTASSWQDIAVALAVVTGRRLNEMLTVGEFSPRTRYTLTFKGQLKVKDKVMPPYEIPTLVDAALVLVAVDRLRSLIGDAVPDEDSLTGVADRRFSDIVPPRSGGNLYTHLFRSVYGCIAVFYFCKPETLDTIYLNRIYGHYWIAEAEGKLQADYAATQHYQDYAIGDTAILAHDGKRQGVKLNDEGVTLLEIFQVKTEVQKGSRKMTVVERPTRKPSQTGFSSAKPSENTRAVLDDIWVEIGARIDDDVLKLVCAEHYVLKTLTGYGASVEEIAALLTAASVAATEDVEAQRKAKKKTIENEAANPVVFLLKLLADRQAFKQSYETRHQGKDYSAMATTELRKHKSEGAAFERWGRAVDAIKLYNDSVELPELRWYINAAVVCELVGGAPTIAKDWIVEHRPDVAEHHTLHKLTPGFNRRGVKIVQRVTVPEYRVVSSENATEEATTE